MDGEAIAALIALSYLPHTWKFFWAPLVDLTWTLRAWYLSASVVTAAGLVLMGWWGVDGRHWALLLAVVLGANFFSTLQGMAVESLMAHATAEAQKGRAAGWFQAGNLGGLGVGGGLGLWLMQTHGWGIAASAMALAGLCLLCALPLLAVREPAAHGPEADTAASTWRQHLALLWADVWALMRSRPGFLAMMVCFLPIGSGAASNLWPLLANDWHASADTVAWVNGVMGGLVSAAGCVVGGYLCDRLDRKLAYCLFGVLQAALAVAMSLSARTELNFALYASTYSFALGMAYAGFSGVVLEAIGRGAAATKYNLLAALSNMPVAYVTYVDGWTHSHWGAGSMLRTEALLGLGGLLVFLALASVRRQRAP